MNYTKIIKGQKYLVGEINAFKCKNIDILCRELEIIFQWSIIENVNCIDAMYDLSWIEEKNYKIILNKFNSIKNENQKKLITDELDSYVKYWNQRRSETENNFIIEYR